MKHSGYKDLSGKRFGRLLVIKRVENYVSKNGKKRAKFLCQCICGNQKEVIGSSLLSKKTQSCGCLQKEMVGYAVSKENGSNARNSLYLNYKYMAKKRNIVFNLTKNDFIKITSMNCYYCGAYPTSKKSLKYGNGDYIYNGIDRLNAGEGYILENVVSCCWTCNKAKSTMSENEFKEWISRVFYYMKMKNNI